jgi:hypothetical protein
MKRREFIRNMGISAAALPFISGLPSFASVIAPARKQRLIVMFSPNGIVPAAFWPDYTPEKKKEKKNAEGTQPEKVEAPVLDPALEPPGDDFFLRPILKPLEPFKDEMLLLKGISNKVRGDGDSHMRGMSCLLTGIELFPGNIQGGSDTPAGWASGISIDQELKNFFQGRESSRTRFGSLEYGVAVPNRADPWTRMSYAGPNKPVAPMDDPYLLFEKVYGRMKDKDTLKSILDDLKDDFRKVTAKVSSEDKRLLDEHLTFVREMERDLQASDEQGQHHAVPKLDAGVLNENDNIPKISRMQIDLLVNGFQNDFARVATLQYTNSVGNARMKWVGVDEGHHTLSHDPDLNEQSQEKLTKINAWFAGELAYLCQRLSETPEPGGSGTLLDNTLIVWTNELGKGNSHTLDNIPFLLLGNGCDFKMGRFVKFQKAAHNRLWMSIAHAMGHPIPTFGNPKLCAGGPLDLA